MKATTYYTCEICGKVHHDEQEAKQHEVWHNICVCQGGGSPSEYRSQIILGYGTDVRNYIDFKKKLIVMKYEQDTTRVTRYSRELPIKFCPYCGRNLTDDEI